MLKLLLSISFMYSRSISRSSYQNYTRPNVVGKERVKFYSRPVIPGSTMFIKIFHFMMKYFAGNQSLVPVIKYAPDVSRSGRYLLLIG